MNLQVNRNYKESVKVSKETEIVKPIMDKAKAAIVKTAKAKGYQYVMDASSLIVADGPNLYEDVKKELKF